MTRRCPRPPTPPRRAELDRAALVSRVGSPPPRHAKVCAAFSWGVACVAPSSRARVGAAGAVPVRTRRGSGRNGTSLRPPGQAGRAAPACLAFCLSAPHPRSAVTGRRCALRGACGAGSATSRQPPAAEAPPRGFLACPVCAPLRSAAPRCSAGPVVAEQPWSRRPGAPPPPPQTCSSAALLSSQPFKSGGWLQVVRVTHVLYYSLKMFPAGVLYGFG